MGDEHQLVLEIWDTPGRHVCQPVLGLFVSAKTLCVIVYDVTDTKATERVLTLFRVIRQKSLGTRVVLVGTKADLQQQQQQQRRQLDCGMETIHHTILQTLATHDKSHRGEIAKEIGKTRAFFTAYQTTQHRKAAAEMSPVGAEKKTAPPETASATAQDTPLQHHLTYLEDRLSRAITGDPSVLLQSVVVSALSGKGLGELRRILLEGALETARSPRSSSSCSSNAVRQSTAALYDRILALRERDVVLLPWPHFVEEEAVDEGAGVDETTLEEDVTYLSDVGGLTEFRVGHINFPTSPETVHDPQNSEKKRDEKKKKKKDNSGLHSGITVADSGAKPPTSVKDSAAVVESQETTVELATEERYVCVHPALFATTVCLCLVDDDKKSFRFEAGRFWPKDSGFKHPDPQMLCKVLEAIPQQGLLRECLLPLLWQDYPLSEEQVLLLLHVMHGEGLLARMAEQKRHCEGLALPFFPRLSVTRCHALPLLSLLPDNRPQLNWTSKPFVGDIQVTWSFYVTRAHTGLLQRLLAMTQFLSRECSNYHHLWRYGVLLRVGEATICVEMPESEDRVTVSCRVNGDELGQEKNAARMLWVTMTPFLVHLRHFLLRWPGLLFKESIQALGQQFYQDEKLEEEPELPVHAALSLWHRRTCLTLLEGDREVTLDIGLLFPFPQDTTVVSGDGWLKLIMSRADVIMSDASVTVTSFLPPASLENSFKRLSSVRHSIGYQRKKKSVEIKWKLQEENNSDNETSAVQTTAEHSAKQGGNKPTATDDMKATSLPTTTSATDQTGHSLAPPGRGVVTAQEREAEALRLASGFVAAIMASALADYVAQEAERDRSGKKLISPAQVAAARLTAEAALAAQSGDIDGAAKAVIDAVKAVKKSNSIPGDNSKTETRKRTGGFAESKLCAIV